MTDRPLSPEEKLTYSQILGRGLYSGLQLKNHLLQGAPEEEEEKLVIRLPKDKLQSMKKASILDNISPALSMVKGFQDKKKEYVGTQKTNLDKELADAEKDYLDTLVKSKKASFEKEATPNVDALCLGMLKEIEKSADDNISQGSIGRLLGSLAHPITRHIPSKDTIKQKLITEPVLAATLGTYLLKKNMGAKSSPEGSRPINIEVEAV